MAAYGKMLKDTPGLSGKVTLGFTIQTSGEIADLKIVANTVNNADLEKMILEEFTSCKFVAIDPSAKPAPMTYPLLFFPR